MSTCGLYGSFSRHRPHAAMNWPWGFASKINSFMQESYVQQLLPLEWEWSGKWLYVDRLIQEVEEQPEQTVQLKAHQSVFRFICQPCLAVSPAFGLLKVHGGGGLQPRSDSLRIKT